MRNMLELSCNRSLLMFESIKVFNERRKALPARTQVTLVVDFLNWLDQGCTPRQTIQLMHSMALELRDKDLSRALENVQSRLSEGKTLADALQPWVSEELYLMLASGAPIPTILSSIERYQQMLIQQQALRQTLVSKMSYPLVLCIVALLSLFGVGHFVMPRLSSLLNSGSNNTAQWPWWSSLLLDLTALFPYVLMVLVAGLLVFAVAVNKVLPNQQRNGIFGIFAVGLRNSGVYQIYRGWYAVSVLNRLRLLLSRGFSLGHVAERLQRNSSGLAQFHFMFMRSKMAQGETDLCDIMNSGLLDQTSVLRLRMSVGRGVSRAEQLEMIAQGIEKRTGRIIKSRLQRLVVGTYSFAFLILSVVVLGIGQMIFKIVSQWQ